MSDALRLVEQALAEKMLAQAQVRQLAVIVATLQGVHCEPTFSLTKDELDKYGKADIDIKDIYGGVQVRVRRG